ncbi:DUF5946 family protein [Geodermatophilus sp. SYSU D00079]
MSSPRPTSTPPGPDPVTVRCPGCGSVLALPPGGEAADTAPAAVCARLFEETVRGIREEAADPAAASTVALADDAYALQHPDGDPRALRARLGSLSTRLAARPVPPDAVPPTQWRTTIADVAADLDVIDLSVLVEAWARAVLADWTRTDAAVAGRPPSDAYGTQLRSHGE